MVNSIVHIFNMNYSFLLSFHILKCGFSGKITMHVLMMKHSDSWLVYIVAHIITCLLAKNFKEELQMELHGMAILKKWCLKITSMCHGLDFV